MFLSNKSSIKADGVGDLYRCADKLAKGNISLGMTFFKMAKEKIGDLFTLDLDKEIVTKNSLYWAEMVLDEYMRLKRLV
jgi:hypothetical protein